VPAQGGGFDLQKGNVRVCVRVRETTHGVDELDASKVYILFRVLVDDFCVVDCFGSNVLVSCMIRSAFVLGWDGLERTHPATEPTQKGMARNDNRPVPILRESQLVRASMLIVGFA
jgi:hypothetical protein